MRKLTPPEIQSVILAYLKQNKSKDYIICHTGVSIDTIKRIEKRGKIKYKNEYKTAIGRPFKF